MDVVKRPEIGKMDWIAEQKALDEMVAHGAIMSLCECILVQLDKIGAD